MNGERLIGPRYEHNIGEVMAEKRDYYEVLGVERGASESVIKLSLIHI